MFDKNDNAESVVSNALEANDFMYQGDDTEVDTGANVKLFRNRKGKLYLIRVEEVVE